MRHLPTHTDERKFQCNVCGKGKQSWPRYHDDSLTSSSFFVRKRLGKCRRCPNIGRSIPPRDPTFARSARRLSIEFRRWYPTGRLIPDISRIDAIYVTRRSIRKVIKKKCFFIILSLDRFSRRRQSSKSHLHPHQRETVQVRRLLERLQSNVKFDVSQVESKSDVPFRSVLNVISPPRLGSSARR